MLSVVDSSCYRLVSLNMDERGSSDLGPSPGEEDEAIHDSDSAPSTSTCATCESILDRLRSPTP